MDENEPLGAPTPNPLLLRSVRHLDWYDGPVTALVSEESTGPWLAFLLSVQRPRLRIFGLTRTNAEHADAIEGLLSERGATPERWRRIQRRFHIALAESRGPLVLLRGVALLPGESMEQTEVDWGSHGSRVTFSADDAFDRGRVELWTIVFDEALEDDQVRQRFRQWCAETGFAFRDIGFSLNGWLLVFLPPGAPGGAIEASVEVFDMDTDTRLWRLRVRRGGRQWVRDVATEEEARRVAESYLRKRTCPPGDGWMTTPAAE